jgi:hypothetical protein
MPIAGENLNPAEDHPADQDHKVDRQHVSEDFPQVLHEPTLSPLISILSSLLAG